MIDSVNLILNTTVEQIIGSTDVLILLRTYSTLYLGGAECRTCVNSCKRYYNEIKKNGIEMALRYKKSQQRTCIPKFKGVLFSRSANCHISANYLTDEEALHYLYIGVLLEKHFIKLPVGYNNGTYIVEPDTKEEIKEIIESITATYEKDTILELVVCYENGKIDTLTNKKEIKKLLSENNDVTITKINYDNKYDLPKFQQDIVDNIRLRLYNNDKIADIRKDVCKKREGYITIKARECNMLIAIAKEKL